VKKFLWLPIVFLMLVNVATGATKYQEAPVLANLVKQGKLPPVEKRLPGTPMIVKPLEETGRYGGTWRMATTGIADAEKLIVRVATYEPLLRWKADWSGIMPNLAISYQVGDHASSYVFKLRKGIFWSDGSPFTADDILFAVENIWKNKELYPAGLPTWMTIEGKPAVVTKVDNYTVKFKFANSYGLFLQRLATPDSLELIQPSQYLKQFHPQFAKENAIEKQVKEGGYHNWVEMFGAKNDRKLNIHRPTLGPWKLTQAIGTGTNVIFERNPYYWKVDTKGQQLPYIDKLQFQVVENPEMVAMKAIAGEIDCQHRSIGGFIEKLPLFKQNQKRGDYRLYKVNYAHSNQLVIAPNLNHKDPVLRKIFNDRNFRFGLSHAINRKQIIDLVLYGMAKPRQTAPNADSPFYYKPLENVAIEYNPKLANEYLDKAGLAKRDKNGIRLRPDGKRLEFNVEFSTFRPQWTDMMEMIVKDWAAVGIKANIKIEDRTLFTERKSALKHDMAIWSDDGGSGAQVLLEAKYYVPINSIESNHAIAYAQWYNSRGKQGEEPTGDMRKLYDLYDKILITPEADEQVKLMKEILKLNAKNLWVIGICSKPSEFGVVKNKMRNVPMVITESWIYPTPGPTNPEQYFWKL
jgi:peptide/nickel transport system substrate-binding protein